MCVGRRQASRRRARAWKVKTTPIRALKRRKLFDIVGIVKLGRWAKTGAPGSGMMGASEPLLSASAGITCCSSLYPSCVKVSLLLPTEGRSQKIETSYFSTKRSWMLAFSRMAAKPKPPDRDVGFCGEPESESPASRRRSGVDGRGVWSSTAPSRRLERSSMTQGRNA